MTWNWHLCERNHRQRLLKYILFKSVKTDNNMWRGRAADEDEYCYCVAPFLLSSAIETWRMAVPKIWSVAGAGRLVMYGRMLGSSWQTPCFYGLCWVDSGDSACHSKGSWVEMRAMHDLPGENEGVVPRIGAYLTASTGGVAEICCKVFVTLPSFACGWKSLEFTALHVRVMPRPSRREGEYV